MDLKPTEARDQTSEVNQQVEPPEDEDYFHGTCCAYSPPPTRRLISIDFLGQRLPSPFAFGSWGISFSCEMDSVVATISMPKRVETSSDIDGGTALSGARSKTPDGRFGSA